MTEFRSEPPLAPFRRSLQASRARRLLFLLALVVAHLHAQGDEPDDFEERVNRLIPYLNLEFPEGNGPFPAVIMVTGCSGFHAERFSGSYDRDQDRFVQLGYAVARVDYLRAHGLENSCSGEQNPTGEIVPDSEISAYILAVIKHIGRIEKIETSRVHLVGWSLGGTGALNVLAQIPSTLNVNIATAITYFPGCEHLKPWRAPVPVLMLLAQLDNITPPQSCRNVVAELDNPETVEIVEYPGAHHCFVAEDLPIVMEPRPHPTCAYNPQAHEASWKDLVGFLQSH